MRLDTVGDIRKALEKMPDDMPVMVVTDEHEGDFSSVFKAIGYYVCVFSTEGNF